MELGEKLQCAVLGIVAIMIAGMIWKFPTDWAVSWGAYFMGALIITGVCEGILESLGFGFLKGQTKGVKIAGVTLGSILFTILAKILQFILF